MRMRGVPLTLPSGVLPWTVWASSIALLFLSVYLTLRLVGVSGRILACFAAGPDSDTTAWRRFGLLRMLAALAHRSCVAIILISPSVAVFIDLDRTNGRLTEALGYAISPRVVLWYWLTVVFVTMLYASFVGIGWIAVWYVQWTRGLQTRCSECGYLADTDRCCPECGGIQRTGRVRKRALVASLAAPIVTLSAAIMAIYPYRLMLMDAIWGGRPGDLPPAHEYVRSVTRMQASQAVAQRLYFPKVWVGDFAQTDWHRFWMQDGPLILETERYRVEISVNHDKALTIHTNDRLDGVTRHTWDRVDERSYGSTFFLEPTRYDAGLLAVVVEQIDPDYADGLELKQYERAIAVTVEPRYGWRVVEAKTDRRNVD